MTDKKTYSLSDSVLHRIVQIVQEGLIMGVDVSDLMRQVRLTHSDTDEGSLSLHPDYQKMVEEQHSKYLKDAEVMKHQQEQASVVTGKIFS